MCEVLPQKCARDSMFKELLRPVLPSLTWRGAYNYICNRSLVHLKIVIGNYEYAGVCGLGDMRTPARIQLKKKRPGRLHLSESAIYRHDAKTKLHIRYCDLQAAHRVERARLVRRQVRFRV